MLRLRYKKKIKQVLFSIPGLFFLLCFLTKKITPRVIVYHRFGDISSDHIGHRISGREFEEHLKIIKQYFKVMTLGGYLERVVQNKTIPWNTLIITIDDGYMDFYNIAYPLLKKYKLKATLFPVVNFVEKQIWLWPDRIQYAIEKTKKIKIQFHFHGKDFNLQFYSMREKFIAFKKLSDYSISIEDQSKWELIRYFETLLKVVPPSIPPAFFSSVTWEQLKEMQNNGVEIGSHTLNHPILSKILIEDLNTEIGISKQRIEEKLNCNISSFCYPNSAPPDINEKVVEAVKIAGYQGAVFSTIPGNDDLFKIPRIAATNSKTEFMWKISTLESIFTRTPDLKTFASRIIC